MSQQAPFKPVGVVLPAKKDARLLASQIKRPPAQRLAEALLVQFPDIEIVLRDGGFTAAATLRGVAVMLCETYDQKRDGREGWWTLMDEVFPQLVAFFNTVPPEQPVANDAEAPAIVTET